jgi:hypothetical protein
VRRGVHRRKNPLPVTRVRRGLQHTRRLDTHPYGALTSEAAYPLQRSSLQRLLPHGSSYQEALGLHTYNSFLYMSRSRVGVKRHNMRRSYAAALVVTNSSRMAFMALAESRT